MSLYELLMVVIAIIRLIIDILKRLPRKKRKAE